MSDALFLVLAAFVLYLSAVAVIVSLIQIYLNLDEDD